jgi:hypothetical protein
MMASYGRDRERTAAVLALAALTSLAAAAASSAPPADISGGSFANPVVSSNSPDPGVLRLADGSYVMVTTGMTDDGGAFALRTSLDLVNWTLRGAVFTAATLPRWANRYTRPDSPTEGRIWWAPEIHQIAPNRYNCYFVANDTVGGHGKSVGVATSDSPHGPFTDPLGHPLVPGVVAVGHSTGAQRHDSLSSSIHAGYVEPGAIDPTYFHDVAGDGRRYLLWKDEGPPTQIKVRELNESGLAFVPGSQTTPLIKNDQPWEAWNVSALLDQTAQPNRSPSLHPFRAHYPLHPLIPSRSLIVPMGCRGHWAGWGCGSRCVLFGGRLTEIYLCGVCSCPEILRRNGRGQGGRLRRRGSSGAVASTGSSTPVARARGTPATRSEPPVPSPACAARTISASELS